MNKMDKFQCIRTYQAVQLVSMSKDPMSKDSVPGFNSTTHHSYLCVFYSLCVIQLKTEICTSNKFSLELYFPHFWK